MFLDSKSSIKTSQHFPSDFLPLRRGRVLGRAFPRQEFSESFDLDQYGAVVPGWTGRPGGQAEEEGPQR